VSLQKIKHVSDAVYRQIYDLVLSCSYARTPREFVASFCDEIQNLCPYDEAMTFFINSNGNVCDQYLVNTSEKWSAMYLEYFHSSEDGRFRIRTEARETEVVFGLLQRDWNKVESADFVPNYIKQRGLNYSVGFPLFDCNGMQRVIIGLDRTRNVRFSEQELELLSLVVPILNNIMKKFYYQELSTSRISQIPWETTKLTAREIEIANLVCQGMKPANISRALYISLPTTYKHLSNIYEKMHVTSRQELLVRLFRQPENGE